MSGAKLPVIGSTAASTAFCFERLDGPGGLHLFFDGNGKITAGNGTLAAPRANAFSLRNIDDCPQATSVCKKTCYVENLKGAQPALYALYEHNATTIREILADDAIADAWVCTMARWIRENASAGFRWHVSGDVYSLEYARFIAYVVRESAPVLNWIYTRSFDFLIPLVRVCTQLGGNLALNLSCDADNYEAAIKASTRHFYIPDEDDMAFRLCYLTVDGTVPSNLPEGSVIFPDYNIRPRQYPTLADSPWWQTLTPEQRRQVCPVDAHGKSEKNRCGSCTRCMT